MLISHEVPISLLEDSKKFNDYDYCLLHLTYSHPEYKKYYIDASKEGRHVLLDNSVFELKTALTGDKLAQGVLDLQPTEFIVPDCLDDYEKTIDQFISFEKNFPSLPAKKIGVAQGSTVEELIKCYVFMSQHADKIAISFDSKAYDELSDSVDKLDRWCVGRQLFIQHLVDIGVWNNGKPHHLLGCSYAREFSNKLYRKISIESVDTSNPIVAGINRISYTTTGLDVKPSILLCDLIDHKVNDLDKSLITHNVKEFRRICNG